jgi:hypothetical protein
MKLVVSADARNPEEQGKNMPYLVETAHERCYADNLEELVDLFVDHYLYPQPEYDPQLYRSLVMAQALLEEASRYQRVLIANNPIDVTDYFYADTVMATKALPFMGRVTDDGDIDMDWGYPTPLILMRTDYEPYTSRELPTGNVIFIDSSSEGSFLRSLELLKVCRFIDRSQERQEQE